MDNIATLLPRVTIQFCTQCKWMLRAAYFAQELLSTFSTSLGEVALQPSTGGTFIVTLYHATLPESSDEPVTMQTHVLWDRKAEGGFPETKELKRRVRDIIDPKRDLGHVDGKKASTSTSTPSSETTTIPQPTPLLHSPPLPKALSHLQNSTATTEERKFTPMDIDPKSRNVSLGGTEGEQERELLNPRGKVVISGGNGEDGGFRRPGEDCEDCG